MPPVRPEGTATPARSINLAGQAVPYRLRHSRRRSIGLTVDHEGLRVSAPLHARLGDIETLIRQHGQWVLDKLADWRARPRPPALEAAEGGTLTLFGEAFTVSVRPARRTSWEINGGRLLLAVPPAVDPSKVLKTAIREYARRVLGERLAFHAPRLGAAGPPLRLSSARTRWGSCNHRGGITLNWRLAFLPPAVADYVVCHELAHLREMNHGPRFWSIVEALCPEWRHLRAELRRLGPGIPQP
jgi:predicted metal-dependent hydrolase